MPVVDVDGDGDADIATTLAAHGYGLSWFEQVPNAAGTAFVEHVVVPGTTPDARRACSCTSRTRSLTPTSTVTGSRTS